MPHSCDFLSESSRCESYARALSRTHGWVFIIRPHTGVPDLARSEASEKHLNGKTN
jgi:hypothetical protein